MRCTNIDSVCNDFSSKASLADIQSQEQPSGPQVAKLKRICVLLQKGNIVLKRQDVSEKLWKILDKHFHLDRGTDGEDGDLVARGPVRSPEHNHQYQPYSPRRSFSHNGVQRVQETTGEPENDEQVQRFIQELTTSNKQELIQFVEKLLLNESPCNETFANDSWNSIQTIVQDSGLREKTRHDSFSSYNSSVPSPYYSSSGGSLSNPSSPGSPHSQLAQLDRDVADLTNAYEHASVAYCSPSSSSASSSPRYNVVPTTVYSVYDTSSDEGSSPPPPQAPPKIPTPKKDKLFKELPPKEKEAAWARITAIKLELLTSGDIEGDTQLMILLANKPFEEFKNYLYHIVERLLKESPSALGVCNKQGRDVLQIAMMDCYRNPLVAAYIAEAYVRAGIPFKIYEGGETVLHVLAALGDTYAPILEQMLTISMSDGSPAFSVQEMNSKGLTPLHIACSKHIPGELEMYKVVEILIRAQADILVQEYLHKNTPLHLLVDNSADITMLNLIRNLISPRLMELTAEAMNRQNNTVLHLACSKNHLPLEEHKTLVEVLTSFGGRIHIKNIKGYVPSYLVDHSRKEDLRAILHSKSSASREHFIDALTADGTNMSLRYL